MQTSRWALATDAQAFSMPDLSHVPAVHGNIVYWSRLLAGMPTDAFVPSALLVTLARLVDRALEEHAGARDELLAHFNRKWNPDVTYFLRATNRMEALVSTVWRLLGLAEAVRRTKEAPPISREETPGKTEFERLNRIRRAIEHMDERIRNGRVGPGQPTMVIVGNDSIQLEGEEIGHDELAWWIVQMSNLVLGLRAHEAENPSEEWPGILRVFAQAWRDRQDKDKGLAN